MSKKKMDFEFRAQQDHDRRSVEDLFDFQGRMIGRGTYGKVFKAKRKDGFDISFIIFLLFFFFLSNRSDTIDYALKQIDGNNIPNQ
jgi:cyclin-dependent kinase 8/11